jgi:hypothetical protein
MCPPATSRESLNGFSWNFTLGVLLKRDHISVLVKVGQQERTLYMKTYICAHMNWTDWHERRRVTERERESYKWRPLRAWSYSRVLYTLTLWPAVFSFRVSRTPYVAPNTKGDNPDRKHRPSRIAGGWAWGWQPHPGKYSCHEIWRSNSRILELAEASEEDQGPRRAVEPMMMMIYYYHSYK